MENWIPLEESLFHRVAERFVEKTNDVPDRLSAQPGINYRATKFAAPSNVDLVEAQQAEGWDKMAPDYAFVVNPGRGMKFGIRPDAPVRQKRRAPLMPSRNVIRKASRRSLMGAVFGKEHVKPAAAREVLTIIERFATDGAFDRLHLLLASAPVLGSVG